MTIPKIIHQTYARANVPEAIRHNILRLQQMNPGWRYVFYDDARIERFIQSHYEPEIGALYARINPRYGAARADFFRYLLLYKLGGVYLDIKSSATRPLDQIIHDSDHYVLALWPNAADEPFSTWGMHRELPGFLRGEYQNWHIIAEPGHPFLHQAIAHVMANIRNYDPAQHGVGKMGVMCTTGPIAYTRAIGPILHAFPHRLAGHHLDLGLQYNFAEAEGALSHGQFFPAHYSKLDEPVVLGPAAKT